MDSWEIALENFLASWKDRPDIIGIVVCGSYVTGSPTKRSDIDVHLILSEECDWRERGNQYVKGYLIEYFINPPQQIRGYFKEDFENHRTMAMVQFLSGRVLLDKKGIVQKLIDEARLWKNKGYEKLPETLIEMKKYELWDTFDNLLDCYEEERGDFEFVYYNALCHLFHLYSEIIGIEKTPHDHIYKFLAEPAYLMKYMKAPFPDQQFSQRYINAATAQSRDQKIQLYRQLVEHVLKKAGGFQIDGWSLRSDLSF